MNIENVKEFKFEKLEVWRLSIEFLDLIYEIVDLLPKSEDFNLKSQLRRAGTSISLNIAEGSTVSTNAEQIQFLKVAIRSLVEVVACFRIVSRRKYLINTDKLMKGDKMANILFSKLLAFRSSLQHP